MSPNVNQKHLILMICQSHHHGNDVEDFSLHKGHPLHCNPDHSSEKIYHKIAIKQELLTQNCYVVNYPMLPEKILLTAEPRLTELTAART